MRIAIITAMSREVEQLAALLEGQSKVEQRGFAYSMGELGGNTIALICSGIGKVNASVATLNMINHFAPDCIISTGVAGGIDSSLGLMDIVVSSSNLYHDVWCGEGNEYGQVQGLPARFDSHPQLVDSISSLVSSAKIHRGVICSGDQFITSRESLDKIKGQFSEALAVDMESAAIAQVAYIYKVPFVSLRIISDTPGAEGHQAQYENFWGELCDRSFAALREMIPSLPTSI